jgi:hypothetical protein
MTATLADDSIVVTDFGADPEAVSRPITPRTASDLGERMILVPQAVNPEVTDEEIKKFVSRYRSTLNIVVIVPSGARAEFWKDVASPDFVLTADNIQNGVERLKATTGNLAVMVNKYDGVDLPDDACRLLVLDGVPDTRRLIDRYEQSILRDSEREQSRQVQRIEQGMGRAIRSNEDYCVVLLMGQRLISHLFAAKSARFFSPATARQLALSSQVSGQISSLADMREPVADLLNRNPQWVSAARSSLIDVTYASAVTLDPIVVLQRQAFDLARRGRFDAAERSLRDASEKAPDRTVKGWLLEQVAAAVHPQDSARSQEVLLAANDLNSSVTKPLAGISYTRMNTAAMDQARGSASYISDYPDPNSMIIAVNGLLADLIFRPDSADEFELSLKEIGRLLGFKSQRPEKEGAGKLDVLWGLGEDRYLLLPCKSGAVTKTIAKRYTDQVAGELIWFREEYGTSARATSALVHPSLELDADAVPPPEMRIISERQLGPIRGAIQAFAQAVKDHRSDPEHIRRALSSNSLLGSQIVDQYTTSPTRPSLRR